MLCAYAGPRMSQRVCFVLSGLGPSGGVRAVLNHARLLTRDHGMPVTVAVPAPDGEVPPADARIVSHDDARVGNFDIAVATWWQTVAPMLAIPAERRVYFLQNFEERLYRRGDLERLAAPLTHDLPLSFVTEGRWIAELLRELRPEAPCRHVPNGMNKALFAVPAEPPRRDGPLRILVEGSPQLWFKGVAEAVDAVQRMEEPHLLTLVCPEPPPAELAARIDRVLGPLDHREMPAIYADADALLKLSRVEGVFTPPLEAFHCGATAVVWPVTGHDEYVRHRENGIVADWDDLPGVARWLDLLARDHELLAHLRRGALETARAWPSLEESAAQMAAALREIAAESQPLGDPGQLLADLDAGLADVRLELQRLRRERGESDRELEAAAIRQAGLESRIAELESELARTLGSRARRLLASIRS
jgi:glycosyltransferase involved in cell wall biosynthesis